MVIAQIIQSATLADRLLWSTGGGCGYTAQRWRACSQSTLPHNGCLLLEAEEPQGNHETDQAIGQQAQDIREDIHKAFAENHRAVQALHCPGGDADFRQGLQPGWLQEERPPGTTNG